MRWNTHRFFVHNIIWWTNYRTIRWQCLYCSYVTGSTVACIVKLVLKLLLLYQYYSYSVPQLLLLWHQYYNYFFCDSTTIASIVTSVLQLLLLSHQHYNYFDCHISTTVTFTVTSVLQLQAVALLELLRPGADSEIVAALRDPETNVAYPQWSETNVLPTLKEGRKRVARVGPPWPALRLATPLNTAIVYFISLCFRIIKVYASNMHVFIYVCT